jgi:hypothetical protein
MLLALQVFENFRLPDLTPALITKKRKTTKLVLKSSDSWNSGFQLERVVLRLAGSSCIGVPSTVQYSHRTAQ